MAGPILGLHHVTATVDQAQADLDFCLDLLGMRLVKKTVNFDNHDVYHFYYGTEVGAPGTIWTTFPYHAKGVRVGSKGAGQVVATAFSVPATSLDSWRQRLQASGVRLTGEEQRFGNTVLRFDDPSGLWFELVASAHDPRAPWTGNGVGADAAIRGLHSVTMLVRSLPESLALLTGVLGYTVAGETANRTRVAAGGTGPGQVIGIVVEPDAPPAVNGLGTVHHVAMAIATAEEQLTLRDELLARGLRVTEVRDRCYFQSIYFREPGGVLFEVATMQPGFTVDEDLASLGRGLKLPPWEELHRTTIEANLARVEYR
ncbi:MAG TPA: ring-cleaving dioxygenase [Vicinamibacterales bacterium]|nr:ring-cleaving dioxygenase [Vicinamibacterales bacterium]